MAEIQVKHGQIRKEVKDKGANRMSKLCCLWNPKYNQSPSATPLLRFYYPECLLWTIENLIVHQ